MKKLISVLFVLMLCLTLAVPAMAGTPSRGEVISHQVSLREKNASSANRICYLANGTEFEILQVNGSWYYVAAPNPKNSAETLYGWVDSGFVIEDPTHLVLRNRSGVYAYASPYATTKKVGDVSTYQRFTVIGTQGNYYIVSFREAVAFLPMSADYWNEEDIAALVNGPSTKYITTQKENKVYGYDSTKYGAIKTYAKDTVVDVLYITGTGFAAIRYNTVIAFMSLDCLAPSN